MCSSSLLIVLGFAFKHSEIRVISCKTAWSLKGNSAVDASGKAGNTTTPRCCACCARNYAVLGPREFLEVKKLQAELDALRAEPGPRAAATHGETHDVAGARMPRFEAGKQDGERQKAILQASSDSLGLFCLKSLRVASRLHIFRSSQKLVA